MEECSLVAAPGWAENEAKSPRERAAKKTSMEERERGGGSGKK